jgi:hypothetical protein
MLSLRDHVAFEDLVIFRDDEDARKFYLLPDQPVIPVDEASGAEFLFIKYIRELGALEEGEDVGGGYVQFRSVLTIDPERRRRVLEALGQRLAQEKAAGKQPLGLAITSIEPLLALPLWVDGSVTLLTFEAREDGLVRHAPASRPVDLAGDLGASFAMELDTDGAEVFWSAFRNPRQKIPIMISYELKYKARVSARMEIHARHDVVRQRLWRHAKPYVLAGRGAMRWVPLAAPAAVLTPAALAGLGQTHGRRVAAMIRRPDIRRAVEEVRHESAIEVTIQTGEGGEVNTELQQMLYEIATDVLTERVVPAMFGDGAEQPGSSSDDDSRVTLDLIDVQAGLAGAGDARFDLVLDHQSVVERSVNPNGPLELVLSDPSVLESSFKELRLADSFFSEMRVSAATAGVNFARDGIDLIRLDFEYSERDEANPDRPLIERRPGSRDNVLIRSESDSAHWRFDTARYADGRHKRTYRYRPEVHYREGPTRQTPWTTSSERQLLLTPRAIGALRVELALTASSEVVESARVVLAHRTPGGTVYRAERELRPGGENPTWLQYTGEVATQEADRNPLEYTYQVTYRLPDGTLAMPERTSNAELLEIPSPFARVLAFTLRPQGAFDEVASIAGDLVYDDEANGYRVRRSFQFTRPDESVVAEIPVLDGGSETVRWTARLTRTDGSAEDLPGGSGGPGSIWIGGETDFLEVQVLPDLIDFDADVQLAVVTLSYQPGDAERPETKTLTFSKDKRDPVTWRVGRGGSRSDAYDVSIRYIAYDRPRSAEVVHEGLTDAVLVLDRQ